MTHLTFEEAVDIIERRLMMLGLYCDITRKREGGQLVLVELIVRLNNSYEVPASALAAALIRGTEGGDGTNV